MSDPEIVEKEPFLLRLWGKIPVIIRALVLGTFVFLFLQLGQTFLILNIEFATQVPWVAPAILAFLYFGFRYFAGWGWPRSTKLSRAANMRIGTTSKKRLSWGYVTAVVALVHMATLAVVLSSVVQFPEESFAPPPFVAEMPELTAFVLILCFALVAGVSEESGFRGYAQAPLEKRYGIVPAVVFIALLFWLAHYDSASFVQRFPLLFGAGMYAGFLAAYSRNLGPPILVHFAADAIGFTMVAGLFGLPVLYSTTTIWQEGPDLFFWKVLGVMIGTGIVTIIMLIAMSRIEDDA